MRQDDYFKKRSSGYDVKSIALTILLLTSLLFSNFVFAGKTDTLPTPADEFLSVDSFQEFKDSAITALTPASSSSPDIHKEAREGFHWTLLVLSFTILAGFLVRFNYTRYLRSLFLVSSLVILGFYRGACPCPISSLQNTAFFIMGNSVKWQSIILFLGLIPITYFFGRVFCGWICQLGALQEFIFASSRFKFLQSYGAQKSMRSIRAVALGALLIQLSITQTNLFKKIDPFAVIYNFYSPYIIGWVLAAVLLISSVFIYRPFCKTICPIGLILGWISKIPGASILGSESNCISCANCSNNCKIRAITHDNNTSVLQNEECIRCGECITGCKRHAMSFFLNGKKHVSECTSMPSIKQSNVIS